MMARRAFRHIVLAVDASGTSGPGIEFAVDIAARAGAAVTVAHVWQRPRSHEDELVQLHAAQELVSSVAADLDLVGVKADIELRTASRRQVGAELGAIVERRGADLLIVGSRGLSDAGGLIFGSTSHAALEATECPVLVVRADAWPAPVRRLALAVSGGDGDRGAIEAAIAITRLFDAHVFVVHVAPPPVPEAEANRIVARAVARLRRRGLEASGEAVAGTDVAGEIAAAADRQHADLIVTGSRRLGDLEGLVRKAISHEVVHRTNRPVLVSHRSA
jgi:nucleotide-binding universal stress UspA family protein